MLRTTAVLPFLFAAVLASAAQPPIPEGARTTRREWSVEGADFEATFWSASTIDADLARSTPGHHIRLQALPTDLGGSIRNDGTGTYTVRELWLNDSGPIFSFDALDRHFGLHQMEPELQLARLYRLVTRRFAHAESRPRLPNNPLVLLNVAAGGYCDQSTRILTEFAHRLGIKTTTYDLIGHVLADYQVGDRWLLLDGDQIHAVRERGTRLPTGRDAILKDPSLAFRVHPFGPQAQHANWEIDYSRRMAAAGLFHSQNRQPAPSAAGRVADLELAIGPGERLDWSMGDGRLVRFGRTERDLVAPLWRSRATLRDRLDEAMGWSSSWLVWRVDDPKDVAGNRIVTGIVRDEAAKGWRLREGSSRGSMTARHTCGLPVFGVEATVRLRLPEGAIARLRIESPGSKTPREVMLATGPFDGEATVSIGQAEFPNPDVMNPVTTLELERGSGDGPVEFDWFEVRYAVGLAESALPWVARGDNHLRVVGTHSGEADIALSLGWIEYPDALAPTAPDGPTFPPDGAPVADLSRPFEWPEGSSPRGLPIIGYAIELSDRPGFDGWPWPEFRRVTPLRAGEPATQAQFFEPQSLKPGTTYYWHVRPVDAEGLRGEWSPTWSFTPAHPETPMNVAVHQPTETTLVLEWDAVPGATRYEVHADDRRGFVPMREAARIADDLRQEPTLLATVGGTSFPLCTDGIASAPIRAFYRVIAFDEAGNMGEASAQGAAPLGYAYRLRDAAAGSESWQVVSTPGAIERRHPGDWKFAFGYFDPQAYELRVAKGPDFGAPTGIVGLATKPREATGSDAWSISYRVANADGTYRPVEAAERDRQWDTRIRAALSKSRPAQ